jgi:hypothetical protein
MIVLTITGVKNNLGFERELMDYLQNIRNKNTLRHLVRMLEAY